MSSSSLNTSQKQLFEQQPQQAGSFIDRQLQRATAQVRLVDVLGGFLLWSSLTLGFLLLLAIVDAWVFALPIVVRLAALITIVVASLIYLASSLWPLLTRRINPMYAAKMLEEGQPSLKNSLVNFLSFRQAPAHARKRILEAMANKAAVDLSRLSIETSVDRGKLIRFGYLLVGLVAICAAYMVLSPKSPLTTLGRIAAPLADVPPPSRVRILEVQPGDIEVSFGDALQVIAEVKGLGRDELVELLFTTDDRQRVDSAIPMTLDEARGVYVAPLVSGSRGVEHALTYHVTAGDARSQRYRVALRQAVTATIEQVELTPPAYTELPARQETRGDLEGVEGTEVVVRGKANYPLQAAVLELLRPGDGAADRADPSRKAAKRIRMELDDTGFVGRFKLELSEDRTTPLYSDYRIALLTTDQQTNAAATHYHIAVFPDMAPEVRWIRPQETEVELPVNGRLVIETQAIDRDFAISRVVLRGDHNGRQVLGEELLDASRRADDQHLGKYNLRPEKLGLQAGDTLVLYAMAEDNRCHPQSGLPDPNSARTENVTVRITSVDPRAEAGSGDGTGGGAGSADDGGGGADSDDPSSGGQAGTSTPRPDQPAGSEENTAENRGGAQPQPKSNDMNQTGSDQVAENTGQAQGSGADGSRSDEQQGGSPQEGSGSSAAGGNSADQQSGNQPGGGGQEGTEAVQPGGQTTSGGENSPTDPGAGTSPSSRETGGGATEGNREGGAGESNPATSPNATNAEAGNENGLGETAGDNRETSGDAPHEGEVFEKVLDRLKQQKSGAVQNQSGGDPSPSDPAAAEQNQEGGEPGASGGEQPESGASPTPAGGGANQTPEGTEGSKAGSENNTGRTGSDDRPGSKAGSPMNSQNPQTGNEGGADASQSDPQATPEGGTDVATDEPGTGGQAKSNSADSATGQSERPSSSQDQTEAGNEGTAESESATGSDPSTGNRSTTESGSDQGEQTDTNQQGTENKVEDSASEPAAATSGGQSGSSSDARSTSEDVRESKNGTPGQRAQQAGLSDGSDGELPEGEQANLDYSRRATDLVLDYLKDQEAQPDRDLLSELNWTEEDLRNFLARWEAMRQAAREGSPTAQDTLTRRIRSLGLMPRDSRVGGVETRDDNLSGIVQDGAKSSPPPEFAEKFRLFLKGAAQAETPSEGNSRSR